MPGRYAVLIGCGIHDDEAIPDLEQPHADINALSAVLCDSHIGGFAPSDVIKLPSPSRDSAVRAIAGLFSDRRRDDLLLLYYSGHGIRVDDTGPLHLAARDTRATSDYDITWTGIESRKIVESMESSRSRKIVLLLDCCYSGGFMKRKSTDIQDVDLATDFQCLGGLGRAVLTASASHQRIEIDRLYKGSEFTHHLVVGLESGNADIDEDGLISMNDLFLYVSSKLSQKQTCTFWVADLQGQQLVIARNPELSRRSLLVSELAKLGHCKEEELREVTERKGLTAEQFLYTYGTLVQGGEYIASICGHIWLTEKGRSLAAESREGDSRGPTRVTR